MLSEVVDAESNEASVGELRRDGAWRRQRVSVAAYYCAQRRGFEPGGEAEDWRLAEAEVTMADESGE
jgi:hypothetical protein